MTLEQWRQRWSRTVARWGDRPALRTGAGVMSFAELDARARSHQHHCEQQEAWAVGACQAWGWSDPWVDLPRLLGLWLAGGAWIAHAEGSDRSSLACELAAAVQGPDQGDALWQSLLFSSGSTGKPKLLVRGWRQALAEADAYAELLALPAGAQTVMLIHPWFGASTKQVLAGLLHGWCQAIGRPGLEAVGQGGDLLYATPSQIQSLGPPSPQARGFAWISLTGEPCSAALWPLLRQWGRPEGVVLNALGASETGVIAHQLLPLAGPWRPFAGQPAPGKEVDLFDAQAVSLTRPGAIGRLRVRGAALIEGQLQWQGSGWRLQPLPRCGAGMEHLSYDLARWDQQGQLEWLGRSNQLLKRHGEWLDAAPLQQWLERQPGVRRCQLFGETEGLIAWLEADSPRLDWLEALGWRVQRELADPRLQPWRLCALHRWPLNPNGKLDLAALRAAQDEPERLGGVGWTPAAAPLTLAAHQPQGLVLDSLDQAQWIARLQDTNLLWCGPGLRQVAAASLPGVGVVGLPFPRVPPDWSLDQGPCLAEEVHALSRSLLQLTDQRLGREVWLGGFSAAAWLAYALAEPLVARELPVRGVVLLDPVDLFSGTFRWPWRRRLADRWRRGIGGRFYRHLSPQRLHQKAWTQELLGGWRPEPLDAELLLIRSRWRHRLSHRHARALQPGARFHELPCRRHEEVLSDPQVIAAWQGWITQALAPAAE